MSQIVDEKQSRIMEEVGDTASPSAPLKVAYVLFMDIVGYSMLPTDRQVQAIRELIDIVRATEVFRQWEKKRKKMLRLPTGDGMVLAFLDDPAAPLHLSLIHI